MSYIMHLSRKQSTSTHTLTTCGMTLKLTIKTKTIFIFGQSVEAGI